MITRFCTHRLCKSISKTHPLSFLQLLLHRNSVAHSRQLLLFLRTLWTPISDDSSHSSVSKYLGESNRYLLRNLKQGNTSKLWSTVPPDVQKEILCSLFNLINTHQLLPQAWGLRVAISDDLIQRIARLGHAKCDFDVEFDENKAIGLFTASRVYFESSSNPSQLHRAITLFQGLSNMRYKWGNSMEQKQVLLSILKLAVEHEVSTFLDQRVALHNCRFDRLLLSMAHIGIELPVTHLIPVLRVTIWYLTSILHHCNDIEKQYHISRLETEKKSLLWALSALVEKSYFLIAKLNTQEKEICDIGVYGYVREIFPESDELNKLLSEYITSILNTGNVIRVRERVIWKSHNKVSLYLRQLTKLGMNIDPLSQPELWKAMDLALVLYITETKDPSFLKLCGNNLALHRSIQRDHMSPELKSIMRKKRVLVPETSSSATTKLNAVAAVVNDALSPDTERSKGLERNNQSSNFENDIPSNQPFHFPKSPRSSQIAEPINRHIPSIYDLIPAIIDASSWRALSLEDSLLIASHAYDLTTHFDITSMDKNAKSVVTAELMAVLALLAKLQVSIDDPQHLTFSNEGQMVITTTTEIIMKILLCLSKSFRQTEQSGSDIADFNPFFGLQSILRSFLHMNVDWRILASTEQNSIAAIVESGLTEYIMSASLINPEEMDDVLMCLISIHLTKASTSHSFNAVLMRALEVHFHRVLTLSSYGSVITTTHDTRAGDSPSTWKSFLSLAKLLPHNFNSKFVTPVRDSPALQDFALAALRDCVSSAIRSSYRNSDSDSDNDRKITADSKDLHCADAGDAMPLIQYLHALASLGVAVSPQSILWSELNSALAKHFQQSLSSDQKSETMRALAALQILL